MTTELELKPHHLRRLAAAALAAGLLAARRDPDTNEAVGVLLEIERELQRQDDAVALEEKTARAAAARRRREA